MHIRYTVRTMGVLVRYDSWNDDGVRIILNVKEYLKWYLLMTVGIVGNYIIWDQQRICDEHRLHRDLLLGVMLGKRENEGKQRVHGPRPGMGKSLEQFCVYQAWRPHSAKLRMSRMLRKGWRMDSDGPAEEPKERWWQNSVWDPGLEFDLGKKPVEEITVNINEITIF